MTTLNDLMWSLTSKFTKNPKSNIGKLLKIFAEQYDLVMSDLQRQLAWRNIDVAEGIALDNIGTTFGIHRGTWDDEQYRVRIKTGIARNVSNGTINSVIEILAMTLSIDVSQIQIDTMWKQGEPDTIKISSIPYGALVASGMTQDELIEITTVIVAAGIKVETLELSGTFQFAPTPNVSIIDPDHGFQDIANGTGGTFGAIMKVN